MRRDALSAMLPGRHFITIHPDLLDMMSYHEAALLHEVVWRAAEDDGSDGWVKRSPEQWAAWLHLTPKQLRGTVDTCLERGWLVAEARGDAWDRGRSFKVDLDAIARDMAVGGFLPRGRRRQNDVTYKAHDSRLTSQMTGDLQSTSSSDEEPLEEPVVTEGSSSVHSDVGDADVELLLSETNTTTTPTPRPPSSEPRLVHPVTGALGPTMPKWMQRAERERLLQAMQQPKPAKAAAAPAPDVPGEDARSTAEPRERHFVIRRPQGLARALRDAYGFEPSTQTDQRNMAKLLELKPTLAQLDGAVEHMGWTKGDRLDLGRLVSKWGTLSQFGAKRPASWNTRRTRDADAVEAHVAAGGNRYDYDGNQKGLYDQ